MAIPPQYQTIAQQAATANGIPIEVLDWILTAESNWNPGAVGDNGTSYGLAQIHLPAHPDVSQEQATNPVYAIFWTAKELAGPYKQFNGNIPATVLYHNNPQAAEYLARTGQYGPGPGQAQASQHYLNYVLQPVGGVKGVMTSYHLSTTGSTPTGPIPTDPNAAMNTLSAQGTGSVGGAAPATTPAPANSGSMGDPTMMFANAIMNVMGMGNPQMGTGAQPAATTQPTTTATDPNAQTASATGAVATGDSANPIPVGGYTPAPDSSGPPPQTEGQGTVRAQ